jgi:hypothetical protein
VWAIEKGNSLRPASWHTTAERLVGEIAEDKAYAKEINIPEDETAATDE